MKTSAFVDFIAPSRLRERLDRGEVIDLRDGKARGGLVLAIQAFGAALRAGGVLDVQDMRARSLSQGGN